MAIVNGSLELGYKNLAWFTANPTLVLKEGQIVYLEQTGTYKIGNGTSTLSALSFLGVSSETQTLQNVTDLGATTTNSITANSFIKSGGLATQFLKADGSIDSNDYITLAEVPDYSSVLKHTVKAGEAINKGQAVYVSSANGTNMIVSKASNVSEATSSKTMGLLAQTLALNGQGFVITEGLLDNLNTNSATIGDPVWLGVDGALIYGLASKPYAPSHLVFIGIVTRVSATVGEIFVKVQNGFELREIHDVDLITTSPSNNEILTFESSTSLWKNKSVVSALGFTPYNSTNPSNYISGITSGMVTTALGFTPYNATNPSGYITSSALTPYAPLSNPTFTTAITTPIINGVSGNLAFNNAVQTSGAITAFTFTKPNNTTQTASTQINGFVVNGGSRQWATGNITTQSENVWGATTYSFVGASTITNAYGNVFNAPIAGTNATITNNWAGQFNGNVVIGSTGQLIEIKQTATAPTYTQTGSVNSVFTLKGGTRTLEFASYGADNNYITAVGGKLGLYTVGAQAIGFFTNATERMTIASSGVVVLAEGVNFQIGTTTGTKFGISQSHKIAFWNAVPIVQPTTSVTASTFVSNTSMILNDTATFDGYTIGQVVKALRNMGLLA